jgi:enterochelin esterase-like enzyme
MQTQRRLDGGQHPPRQAYVVAGVRSALLLLLVVGAVGLASAAVAGAAAPSVAGVPGWTLVVREPSGGSVWQGLIAGGPSVVPVRPSFVYLPPAFTNAQLYQTMVVLHGFPGDSTSIIDGLQFATIADTAIASGQAAPFIAVIPAGGLVHVAAQEWAGAWEQWLIGRVLPWMHSALPVQSGAAATAIAGLSAGGYGAIDIGLRHPDLFGTLESWSGYFHPYADGVLRHANQAMLAAHDPTSLVVRLASRLRRIGTRFFLSSGTTLDPFSAPRTRAYSNLLFTLGLPHILRLFPGGHDARVWRTQLPAALSYAFPVRAA